ncbi:Fmu (Sun) domain-containing protein [Pyrococcus furiosus DSM 3638]|uniref:Fmu (Sun) domain-containing protein n=3 Tax=Pyrococcus furiosus TaxID=2261 RepID=A0A5C0XMQ7_PYRFU|nr:RsmB/NOP family class I SAM-dependent RNA methyltransferase [Pyrococcus furiosus]AAL80790.1 putative nucleolar protein IV (nol1-nop2-sun family) [Pyrococcus furiosus DSM 3638]AFN03459.1 nol1-nop2-sun family nucleolar protein IV [Pyrococcus furiosus COM1]QEK78366.1 Fmu (Sun) domain-containing protein [Pyrococcus furiosus DSM 3638]
MEAEKEKKLSIPPRGIRAIIEAVRLGEVIKPSQYAKREAFKKHDIKEAWLNRVLTMIFYDIMKKQGLIDKAIKDVVGVTPLILDPWLRAALRVAFDVVLFHDPNQNTLKNLKWKASDFISSKTHPYVGMYYWDIFERILEYKPNPKTELERLEWEYLAPAWLIERVRKLLGDETKAFFEAVNRKHEWISIRVNTLKTTPEEVIKEFEEEGVEVVQSKRIPVVLKIKGPYDFDSSYLFRKGKIIVQEEASAVASVILDPKPGEVVVDLAAAPGGKTTHMAELMKNRGKIFAFDIDKARMKRLKDFVSRMGIKIVKPIVKDARKAPEILGEEVADRVMLDAPCTSSGTIGKNPELRWRLREQKIEEMAQLQRELLESAAKLVKPGGRLLYTTCSIFIEEDEDNVSWFLETYKEFRLVKLSGPYDPGFLEGTMRAWPHRHETIGFFYALFEKVTQ